MAQYPQLGARLRTTPPTGPAAPFATNVINYLVDVWLDDYARTTPVSEIVEVSPDAFSYLFDITAQRLIAAWGISTGRAGHTRDASRMAGHPQSAGSLYHRGHTIPHTLGGGTDINLVSQLGRINIGPFRPLERQAVATPGSFYFTYWDYATSAPTTTGHPGQVPCAVDQGLLVAGQPPSIIRHTN